MTVVTRFAPSPTGYLHIGGARTALFNWLFARHHGGTFLLRVEDTDQARSTPDAVQKIYEGLQWLGLNWDGDAISQFARRDRHAEVAHALLEAGHAYRCYASPEELTEMRALAKAEGRPLGYDGRWRDRDLSEAPASIAPVIRLRAPQDGETVIDDQVQGTVTVRNDQLDDMILLRADGTPTYMLAVVVDDHDMGVTHVIRGDDHLTNAFRQAQIFKLMDWDIPVFAHIPLIHGPDSAKLSKRHGALGVEAYRDMGMLAEAMRNYLLRLGWGHGDEEIISDSDAVQWFDLADVGKSPARFDMAKLTNLNGHYIREADDDRLTQLVVDGLMDDEGPALASTRIDRVQKGISSLKQRAKTLCELIDSARFFVLDRPLPIDDKARQVLSGDDASAYLRTLSAAFADIVEWTPDVLEARAKELAEDAGVKVGKLLQPLRAALTGSTASPSLFEVMCILGREETLGRVEDALG